MKAEGVVFVRTGSYRAVDGWAFIVENNCQTDARTSHTALTSHTEPNWTELPSWTNCWMDDDNADWSSLAGEGRAASARHLENSEQLIASSKTVKHTQQLIASSKTYATALIGLPLAQQYQCYYSSVIVKVITSPGYWRFDNLIIILLLLSALQNYLSAFTRHASNASASITLFKRIKLFCYTINFHTSMYAVS